MSLKKLVSFILVTAFMSVSSVISNAAIGDVIGSALNTDIVVYINNYAIPSYAVNGTSVVVAEDLVNFGFDVVWNNSDRTLQISRSQAIYATEMNFAKFNKSGSFFSYILRTDIVVYADNQRVTSYAMNGYTMIPIEELTMYGNIAYDDYTRSLYLNIPNFPNRNTKQIIEKSKISAPCPSILITDGSGMGFYLNSAGGVKLLWQGKNNTGKVINYYHCNLTMYNAVGDYAYDEIKKTPFIKINYVGPVPSGEDLVIFDVIGYCTVCDKVVLDSIDLEYADGTKETIDYGYVANRDTLWHKTY